MTEEGHKVNAPKKFTEEKREVYLGHLAKGVRRGKAAEMVGMERTGVWKYIKKHPGFQKKVAFAEMQANELVEDALFKAAREGNTTACQVWLYNRDPARWKDQRAVKTQITGAEGGPVQIRILSAVPRPPAPSEDDDGSDD